jgi:hypothetical protein
LNIPLPTWFAEWLRLTPPPAAAPVPSPKINNVPDEAAPHWHGVAIDRLRDHGSPARKPGGWDAFAFEVCPTCNPDTVIRFARRWLARNTSDKSDK